MTNFALRPLVVEACVAFEEHLNTHGVQIAGPRSSASSPVGLRWSVAAARIEALPD